MKEKQILAEATGSARVSNRKHFLSLYLIMISITGFFAFRFYFSRAIHETAPNLQPKCGGLLAGDNGEFEHSPPPASMGNPAKSCVWLIQAYDSSEMRLTLQAFKGKEVSTVVLYQESEPGQIHLHPIVLSPESVGKTVDTTGSTFLIILPQADSSSISFRWDSSSANYTPTAYRVTIAEYMGTPVKRLAWQPRRTQERLWWIISGSGAGNELPTDGVEYKIKAEQNGCTQPCSCLVFQAFQVNVDGFLEEFARTCGIKSSGGKFKVNSYPLIIAASANTTLQGATRVELHWPSGREAEPATSTAGLETARSYTNAHPPELYLTTHNFDGSELKALSLASSAVRSVVNTTVSIEAMAFDPNNQQIYFSSQATIYCMDVNGRSVHKVFSMHNDETFRDLAFDHVNGLLYALTDEGGIIVCNQTTVGNMSNNGSGTWTCIRILNSIAPINNASWYHSVALNPAKGEMYVGTETGGLLRAEMDGSNVETVFKGIAKVAGIVVDDDDDGGNSTQLYWVGSWNDRIQRGKLDGSGRVETVIQLPQGTGPWDMIKINDTLFWSTFGNDETVQAMRVTGEDLRVVYSGNHSISRLTAAVISSKIKGYYLRGQHVRSPCDGHGCSHMCVPKASQSFRCLCPEGMHLLEDSKTCEN